MDVSERLKNIDAIFLKELADKNREGFTMALIELIDHADGGNTFMEYQQLRPGWAEELKTRGFGVKKLYDLPENWGAYFINW